MRGMRKVALVFTSLVFVAGCGAKPNAPELAVEQNGKENSWRD